MKSQAQEVTYWTCGKTIKDEKKLNEIYFGGTTFRDFNVAIIIYFYKEINIDPVTVKHAVSLDKDHSSDIFTLNIETGDVSGMNAPLL